MQARLTVAVDIEGDGTSTSFTFDLNAVFASVSNGVGGQSFASLLPSLVPDSVIDISGASSASISKNKITITFSTPPASGTQTNVSIGLGYNSL